jgi:hypothetical protein
MVNPLLRLPRDLGKLLFGVWLLVIGLSAVLDIRGGGMAVILGAILVASGVCFLIGR